jgi:hypothetical protein
MKKIIYLFLIILLISGIFILSRKSDFLNNITGQAELDTSVLILTSTEAFCNADFRQGWNLVSLPCVPENESMQSLLDPFGDQLISIHEYDPEAAVVWHAYNPNLPGWVIQGMDTIDRKKGYWVNLESDLNYNMNASTVSPNRIYLVPGWNLIGYPTLVNRTIPPALDAINGTYDFVYLYNASSSSFAEYTWNSSKVSRQDLQTMFPYFGYWIYSYDSSTLVIDW